MTKQRETNPEAAVDAEDLSSYVGTHPSCATTWLAAVDHVGVNKSKHNVLMTVENPIDHSEIDNQAITIVDQALRRADKSIVTVANTIFPQRIYDKHGGEGFYDAVRRLEPTLVRPTDWGRYFSRLIRAPAVEGGEVDHDHNRLDALIRELKKHAAARAEGKGPKKYRFELEVPPPATTEITVHAAGKDRRQLSGPCLSHLSFQPHPSRGLMLTAVYRNHYYIERLLGNLIGLGRLMRFVANESGLSEVGPLTCLSAHAEVETSTKIKAPEVREMIEQVRGTFAGASNE